MSLTVFPRRARCIQVTGGTIACTCLWFDAPSLPSLDQFSQLSCVDCGHGIHAHVDYESKVVYHNPSTHCAAYAQETHKSQACTCTVQLIDHEPTVNVYRPIALSPSPALPVRNSPNSVTPSHGNTTGPSSDTGTLAITIPSINDNPSSGPDISMLFAPVPVPVHSNSVLHFSKSDAYTSAYHQQSDDASLNYDLAGGSAVHHAPEDYYDYQGHSFEMDGAPSAGLATSPIVHRDYNPY